MENLKKFFSYSFDGLYSSPNMGNFIQAIEDLASICDHLPLASIRLLSMAQDFLQAFNEKLSGIKRIIPSYLDDVEYKVIFYKRSLS